MITGATIEMKKMKEVFILLLFVILAANTCIAQKKNYWGLEGSFGAKTFTVNSNLSAINNLNVLSEGGAVGVVIGSPAIKARIQAIGFYYSASRVAQTVNVVESAALINAYPLQLGSKNERALNPYITGGINYNNIKFFGHYAGEETSRAINYSYSEAPYLGKVASINTVVGSGVEWRLPQANNFVHVFAEVQYSMALNQQGSAHFQNTKTQNGLAINVGVSFGAVR